jgi:hypothetical protein
MLYDHTPAKSSPEGLVSGTREAVEESKRVRQCAKQMMERLRAISNAIDQKLTPAPETENTRWIPLPK